MKYVPALFSNTVMMSLCSSGVAHAQGYLQENKSTGSPYAGEAMFLDQFFDKLLESTGGDLITLSAQATLVSQTNVASETNCTWSDPWLLGPVAGCHLDASSSFVSQALTQLSPGVREFFEVVVHNFDRCRSKDRDGCEKPGSKCEWTQFMGEACVPLMDGRQRLLIYQASKAAYGDICRNRHVTSYMEWAAPEKALNKMCNKTKAACQHDPVCSWTGGESWQDWSPCLSESAICQFNSDWYRVLEDRDATQMACSARPEYEQYERQCNMSSMSTSAQAACLHSACSELFHQRLENNFPERWCESLTKERCQADRRCEQWGDWCVATPEELADHYYARECPLWSVEVHETKCIKSPTENACLANGCNWYHEEWIKCEDGVQVPCDSDNWCPGSGECGPSAAQVSRAFSLTERDKTVIKRLSSFSRTCRSTQEEHACTRLQPDQTSTILDESLVFP
eukprot:TRINITY_DN2664_c0_g2_i2.p1 TRINITY_DN2664_c0_g2~~TRINITY_DN2664_c0_g2_i2.p1  ORF type:complete len:455 (-),score=60.39 TRINITY_DN2664_c0_g2_i2:101-1465(-)